MNSRLRALFRWWPLLYLVVGAAWIVASHDTVARLFPASARTRLLVEAGSAIAYLAITAVLTMLLLRAERHSARVFVQHARDQAALANERLAWMSRHADDIILLLDADGRIVDCNETAVRCYGYTHAELLAMRVFDFRRLGQGESLTMQSQFNVVRASGRLVFETEHTRRDGSVFPVEVSSSQIQFQGREYVQSIIRDITPRRRLERQHAEMAAERDEMLTRFTAQFAAMPLGCAVTDVTLQVLDVNPAFEKMFGYDAATVKASDVLSLIVPRERRDEVEGRLHGSRLSGQVETSIGQCQTRDGRRIVCRWTHVPLRSGDGRGLGMMYICEDVTASLATQKALRDSEARYRGLFEQASDGIFVIDPHQCVVEANPEARRLLGVGPGVPLPIALDDFVVARDVVPAGLNAGVNTLRRERWQVEQRNGRRLRAEASLREMGDGHSLAMLRDQTALEALRWREARQRDLHELLARAVRAVAHSADRTAMYREITRLAVRQGKFLFAWLGELRPHGEVDVVASCGRDDGYLEQMRVSARTDEPEGQGPTGRCLREGVTVVTNHYLDAQSTLPWHDVARRVGVQSAASIPLRQFGHVVATLAVYAEEPDFFRTDIVTTLEQVAEAVSFGLDDLATRSCLQQAQDEALRA